MDFAPPGNRKKDPRLQTQEEWIRDYEDHEPYPPTELQPTQTPNTGSSVIQLNTKKVNNPILIFKDFRTTRKKSVAIDFQMVGSQNTVTAFFGVTLENNRGQLYRVGARGQFVPPEHGKFRSFWMDSVGKEPPRWCRVHKSIRNNFKGKKFTGNIFECTDGKGNPYYKVKDLRAIENAQNGHK